MSVLELLDQKQSSSQESDDVLHILCPQCWPDPEPEYSLCGKDLRFDEVWASWTPDQVCAMCALVLEENGGLCPEGHVP